MAKYIFVCEEEYGVPAKRTVEFEADSLDNVLNEFEMFGVDFCASDWDFAGRIEQWHLSKEPDLRSTVGKKTFDLKAHNSQALESWLNFFAAL